MVVYFVRYVVIAIAVVVTASSNATIHHDDICSYLAMIPML